MKSSSLAPVRKQNITASPNKILSQPNYKRENSYKSPSIVTLKLPNIEQKQMYSTVKDSRGFVVDQRVKEEVVRSMIESRKIPHPDEEA